MRPPPAPLPDPRHEVAGRVQLMRDTSAARWVEERLWSFGNGEIKVGSIIPEGFAAYVRILHPAQRRVEDGGERVRWSTIATWNGQTVHPEMQFDRIAQLPDRRATPAWGYRPPEGSLPEDYCKRLAGDLRAFTATPDECWFCIWDGFGFLDPNRYKGVPRVRTAARQYLLYRGPLDAVCSFYWGDTWQSPNLWWPADRAWCVATDIDLPETYAGGGNDAIDEILNDDQLEALRTTINARVDSEADTINR